jgi:two-component system, OmpR family, phosphate regulon response regulator PhoB
MITSAGAAGLLHSGVARERPRQEGRGATVLRAMTRASTKRSPARILIVAVDDASTAALARELRRHRYGVRSAACRREALAAIRSARPDLVILDLMLPGSSGYEVLLEMQRRPELAGVPVLVLTTRADEAARVSGLELRADDYVLKPFSPRELARRASAVLHRAQARPVPDAAHVLRRGPIVVDPTAASAAADGAGLGLTPVEHRLLVALMERPGAVQSRQQLLESAWNIRARIATRTVDVHVQRLRTKLREHGPLIETVRGRGYRFRGDA